MLKQLRPEVRDEIKRRNGYIRWQDKEVWAAWSKVPGVDFIRNFAERFGEASMVKQVFVQEQLHYENRIRWGHDHEQQRRVRAELASTTGTVSTEGQVMRDVRRLLKIAQDRQAEERRLQRWSYLSPDSSFYNRFSLLQADSPNQIVAITSEFGLNISSLFDKHCYTNQLWLCEQCYIVDAILGRTLDLLNFLNYFYSNYLPTILTGEMATYAYFVGPASGNVTNPVAQVGKFKNSQPWIPILGEPVGVVLQFSQAEIDNGLDWFFWLWPIIGGKIPDLIQNGTCYNMILNYDFSNSSQDSPTNDLGIQILQILYFDFGIDVCALWDTIIYILENCIPSIGYYIVEHYVLCTWGSELDGTNRASSLAAGLIIIGCWFLGLTAAFLILGSIFGSVMLIPIVLLWTIFPAFLLVSIYNWSFGCFPVIPSPLIDDALNLWAYTPTIGGPCSIILGAFINSTDYNANTCSNLTRAWSMSSGSDLGFTNPINVIEFAKVAYGIDWKILNYIRDVYAFLMGGTAPSFDYSDYNTNPIRHRNYTAWFFVAVPTFGALGFMVAWLASLLVLAALSSSLPVFQSMIIAFFAALQFLEQIGMT
jgi:hypothetical protein